VLPLRHSRVFGLPASDGCAESQRNYGHSGEKMKKGKKKKKRGREIEKSKDELSEADMYGIILSFSSAVHFRFFAFLKFVLIK